MKKFKFILIVLLFQFNSAWAIHPLLTVAIVYTGSAIPITSVTIGEKLQGCSQVHGEKAKNLCTYEKRLASDEWKFYVTDSSRDGYRKSFRSLKEANDYRFKKAYSENLNQ